MKIVHILDNLDRGGAQTMLRSVVAGLTARGHIQHIICLNEIFNEEVVAAMRAAGASVEIIGRPRLYGLIGLWHLAAELRRRRPDLVHTELPWGDLIGRTAARVAGIAPIVSTVTARYADKPRLQLWFDRKTAAWADRVAFQSAEIVPFSLAHEGVRRDQVQVIPNGVDADDRDRSVAASALRRDHGGGAATILGMVARLHPQKAHPDLLEAFAKLAGSDIRLWLVGDGPDRAQLTEQARALGIADRVVFAGDRGDVRDWIAAMDIFVHPTYFEGLPLAVLEAMAMGKPVITSPVDGLRSLITSGVDGWLVPPGNPDALAEIIGHVVAHPEERAHVAARGAIRALSQYGSDRVVEAYETLFKSVLEARSAGSGANGRR
ncbi:MULTISPECIES: glycosyltransferase [unclassified Bradyrhizobium]|uniref:glycosyltransferase n=1 Tax=unclassified Bradyrhizobium TaxID=2631580 RepID=UPI0028EB3687|nr:MULTISPECIES: glycosyltransferase [unclassified Bradyrhizobium]